MNNRFIKHFLVIGSGTFLSMVIGFLTTPIITRVVDPTEYGQFSIFTMYSNMALMVLYLGLDQSVVRYFYEKETDDYRRALLFKCLKYPVIGTIITAVAVIIFGILGIFKFELGFKVLVLVCIYTLIQVIYRFSLLLVRLQYKSKLYSTLGIIQKLVYVGLALALIYLNLFSDTVSLAVATVIAAFICMVISIIAERRLWNHTLVKPGDCTISQKELFKYAYPYIFSMGVTTLFQYIDKISLNIYCSYVEVGIYSSTMTLVHVFSIIQTTFNTLWAPMAVEHYTKDKNDTSFYQKGNQVITVIMFFIGFSLILVKDIFAVLLGEKYREAAYILPFLIFNPIMYTISETTVNGLVFKKKSNLQVVVSLGACVVNIIGNTILVPKLGCQGAAISTGISYIVLFTLRTYLSNKVFYVDFHLRKFYLITACAVGYAFYNTFVQFNLFSVVGYIICIAVLVVLYHETILFGLNYLRNMVTEVNWKGKR